MSKEYIAVSKRFIKRLVTFAVLLVLVGLGAFGFIKYQDTQEQNREAQAEIERLSDPEASAKEAEDKLIEEVKKVAAVPDDERPTIANVTDASQLQDQPLFALIENGDKVLLYVNARRQIIYRPSTKQVITAVTLPEDDPAAQNVPQESTTPEQ